MKLEIDSEDMAIVGGVLVLCLIIVSLSSCEQAIDDLVKHRLQQEKERSK